MHGVSQDDRAAIADIISDLIRIYYAHRFEVPMIVIDDDFNTVAMYDPSKADSVSNMTRKAFDTVFETGATRFLNAIKIHKKGNHYDSAKVVFNDEVEASDSDEDEYY